MEIRHYFSAYVCSVLVADSSTDLSADAAKREVVNARRRPSKSHIIFM